MNKTELVGAFDRAMDWLRANPNKHITEDLARNACGEEVSTMNPTATCFCALGRFAKEIGLDTTRSFKAAGPLIDEGLIEAPYEVWDINDTFIGQGRKAEVAPTLKTLIHTRANSGE